MDTVVEFLLQGVHDHAESLAPVVIDQVLDVLQKEEAGTAVGKDTRNVKKERALGLATEAMRLVQSVLLGDSREGERLAWEPSKEHVMSRDLVGSNPGYVTRDNMMTTVVGVVCRLTKAVPLGREDTLAANRLEALTKTTNACKQVDEGEDGVFGGAALESSAKTIDGGPSGRILTTLPSIDGPDGKTRFRGRLGDGQTRALTELAKLRVRVPHLHGTNLATTTEERTLLTLRSDRSKAVGLVGQIPPRESVCRFSNIS